MDYLQIFFLAIVQGLTEFLPISSSAHLILPSAILGWTDQGLAFDVAVHVGSLTAVLWYFRHDVQQVVVHWCQSVTGGKATPESRLGWLLILATIPAGLAGLLLGDFIESQLRSIAVIATTTILFGLLLGVSDFWGRRVKTLHQITWHSALLIGLAGIGFGSRNIKIRDYHDGCSGSGFYEGVGRPLFFPDGNSRHYSQWWL